MAIPVEKCVVIAVWFLTTPGEYHTIGHLFGVARCTVCITVREVCRAIDRVLATPGEYCTVGHLFGVARCSVYYSKGGVQSYRPCPGYSWRIPYDWSPIWCCQMHCVCYSTGGVQSYILSPKAKILIIS